MSLSYLTRFAISDYLKTSNSELFDCLIPTRNDYTGSIPISVVEEKLSSILSRHEDSEADLLIENPDQYLLHASPLSFVQAEEGVSVSGDIDDRILYVIEHLHRRPVDEIIQTHIHQSVQTLNPDRDIVITSLTLGEKVQQFSERVRQHAEWLHHLSEESESDTETVEHVVDATQLTSEHVTHAPIHQPEQEDTSNEKTIKRTEIVPEKTNSKIQESVVSHSTSVDDQLSNTIGKESTTTDGELTSASEEKVAVVEKADDTMRQHVDDAVAVLTGVYNQFIQTLKDTGIAERVAFDEPLAFAL